MTETARTWTIHKVGTESWPLIIHVPHSSAFIPDHVREYLLLDDHEISDELRLMTDHYTDRLAFDAPAAWGISAHVFVNNVSRLVVDPERLPDDQEPMAGIGMGAVYRVTSNLQPLREPDPKEEHHLLDEWFHPYASAFAGLVDDNLAEHGRCLIIDLHSYPSVPLRYELDPSARRPGVCVGADRFHTPMRLIESAEFAFESVPDGVALDTPFAGTYVPLAHLGRTKAVHSVMIEIRRDLYQDEPGGPRHQGYDNVVTYLSRFLASAVSVIGITM